MKQFQKLAVLSVILQNDGMNIVSAVKFGVTKMVIGAETPPRNQKKSDPFSSPEPTNAKRNKTKESDSTLLVSPMMRKRTGGRGYGFLGEADTPQHGNNIASPPPVPTKGRNPPYGAYRGSPASDASSPLVANINFPSPGADTPPRALLASFESPSRSNGPNSGSSGSVGPSSGMTDVAAESPPAPDSPVRGALAELMEGLSTSDQSYGAQRTQKNKRVAKSPYY